MLIHSITPTALLMEQEEARPLTARMVAGGYLEGYDTPQGFQAARLYSTDPAQYLKSEYAPGSILPG